MAFTNLRITWTDNSTGAAEETGTDIQVSHDSISMVTHEYDPATGIPWMRAGSVAANVTQFDISVIAPISYLRFRVRSRNANGYGPWDSVEGTRIDIIPVNGDDKPVAVSNTGAIVLDTPPVIQDPPTEPPVDPPTGATNPTVIGLGPDLQSVEAGQTVPLTVTLSNAYDTEINVALTSDDTDVATVPSTVAVPIGSQGALFNVTGVVAGSALITAAYNSTARDTTVAVTGGGGVPPSQGGLWPNQPVGSTILSDRDASLLRASGGGWIAKYPTGGNAITDATAPVSPSTVMEWTWNHNPNNNGGNYPEPQFVFNGDVGVTNFYFGFYVKIPSPFYGWSTGQNKICFVWSVPPGNKMYNFLFQGPQGGPYNMMGQLNYVGATNLFANAGSGSFSMNAWHLIELHHVKSTTPTSANGIYRVFIDGNLAANYTNINYPSNFYRQDMAPVWDSPGATPLGVTDREYFDHVRISTGGTYSA